MALTIISNPTAIGAQGSVNNANNALSKTIKQLSTGLRINSSADDASGLAVSEKLRGQISGLKVASRNAQDGISYLQTAEVAIGTMNSMVQRIRELAVQAGDPAYTSTDRVMLQTEVDQLLEEVNRVSSSSEFNTKKMLNGDASALWSATDGIEALVKGSTIAGNYNIETTMTPGKNNVYKTNIMNIAAGAISYDVDAFGGGISRLDNIKGVLTDPDAEMTIGVSGMGGVFVSGGITFTTTGITTKDSASALGTSVNGSFSITVERVADAIGAGVTTADIIKGGLRYTITNLRTGETTEVLADIKAGATTSVITVDTGSFTKLENAFEDVGLDLNSATFSTAITAMNFTTAMNVKGATTGFESVSEADIQIEGTDANNVLGSYGGMLGASTNWSGKNVTGGSVAIEVEAKSGKEAGGTGSLRFKIINLATGKQSDWADLTVDANGTTSEKIGADQLTQVGLSGFLIEANGQVTTDKFNRGDKYIVSVQGRTILDAGASSSTTAGFVSVNGANVFYDDIVNADYDITVEAYTVQLDDSGKTYYGSLDIEMSRGDQVEEGTTTLSFLGEGDEASLFTKLSQLDNFTNSDGRMVLDNTRELTIYGNNRQAVVTLEGEDTIADFETKLSAALVDALDLGAAGAAVNDNLVKFIGKDDFDPGSNQALQGTFIIQGAKIGDDSKLAFSSDQGVLDGLGFDNIQEGTGSTITATVKNAHTGEVIGSDTVSDGILRGILQNVDIKLDQNIGSEAVWNAANNSLNFVPTGDIEIANLHLVNNPTIAAIGANEGQTLDISIGRMDSTTLNLDGINVITIEDSQSAITRADQALESINKTRSVLGAQMNRLEYTISNLDSARENMVAAESRVRDLDIAEASTMLASQQVILQSATAMLAQANQFPTYAAQLLR